MLLFLRSLLTASCLIIALGVTPLLAEPSAYVLEPVTANVAMGYGAELAVRVVHKPTGKSISGVVFLRTRLDMAPDNMTEMTTSHSPLPSTEPGVYKFRAYLTMPGAWALSVAARVPGESEVVRASAVFRAK